jgi:hypothetical protein
MEIPDQWAPTWEHHGRQVAISLGLLEVNSSKQDRTSLDLASWALDLHEAVGPKDIATEKMLQRVVFAEVRCDLWILVVSCGC